MTRWINKLAALALLTGAAGTTAAGCAANESSLFIAGVLNPKPPECVGEAKGDVTVLVGGTLDVAFSNEYEGFVLVGNQLAQRGDPDVLRTETMRVALKGLEVQLTQVDGTLLTEYTVSGVGFAHPGNGTQPGYGVIGARIIPAPVGKEFAGVVKGQGRGARLTVLANIRAFGNTLGGEEIESSELSFPIDICYGCTVFFPLEAIDPSTGECTADEGGSDFDLGCFSGQSTIDCRNCTATHSVCRTPG